MSGARNQLIERAKGRVDNDVMVVTSHSWEREKLCPQGGLHLTRMRDTPFHDSIAYKNVVWHE